MSSGRRARDERREERLRRQGETEARERRRRLAQLGSAAAFLAIVAVAVLVVISQSGGGAGSGVEGVAEIKQELRRIPQRGMVLGDPSAEVKLIEFGDLQCPACKAYAAEILPELIDSRVRSGEATIEFRNFTIISQESVPAGAAAVAAGRQGRGWDFVELFYRNQGREASGYVTDSFLTEVAKGAGVASIARWNSDRKSRAVRDQVSRTTAEAERLGFSGTPSFAVEGPGSAGLRTLGTPRGAADLEAAIDSA